MVEITQERYDYLIARANLLSALESAGVDNWDGWDYAMDIFNDD